MTVLATAPAMRYSRLSPTRAPVPCGCRTLSLAWGAKPAKQIALTALPIESNLELVYRELGVYAAKRFGVPCDDL